MILFDYFEGWDLHCKCILFFDVAYVYRLFHYFCTLGCIQISSKMTLFVFFTYVQRLRIINLRSFIYVVYNRAIVLEPGNPSMKSQIKALAAVEGNFSFVSSTLWMNFSCNIWSVKVSNCYCHWDEQLEISFLILGMLSAHHHSIFFCQSLPDLLYLV